MTTMASSSRPSLDRLLRSLMDGWSDAEAPDADADDADDFETTCACSLDDDDVPPRREDAPAEPAVATAAAAAAAAEESATRDST